MIDIQYQFSDILEVSFNDQNGVKVTLIASKVDDREDILNIEFIRDNLLYCNFNLFTDVYEDHNVLGLNFLVGVFFSPEDSLFFLNLKSPLAYTEL